MYYFFLTYILCSKSSLSLSLREIARNIILQWVSFVVLLVTLGVIYAAYVTINPSHIESGKKVTSALMTQIKANLDDLNARVNTLQTTTTKTMETWTVAPFCGMTNWETIPNSDGNTFCAFTAIDVDWFYMTSDWNAWVRKRSDGFWEYKIVAGCWHMNYAVSCFKLNP